MKNSSAARTAYKTERDEYKLARARRSRFNRKSNLQLWLIALPAIIKVAIFSYVPLIGLVLAFKFYQPRRGYFGSPWVGWANFERLFKSQDFTTIVTNAIVNNILFIITGTIVALLVGLFMFEVTSKGFTKFAQTTIIFPFFVAWPLVATLVKALLDDTGIITNLIYKMTGEEINFYARPEYWRVILVILNIWKNVGLSSLIYYAVLTGSDSSVYEAASIDGAGRFKKMWYLSLPMLRLMIVINIIMSTSNLLRFDFGMVYYTTQQDPRLYPTTDVIETYMYRALRDDGDYSVSTAVGLVQGVVGFVLTLGTNWLAKKVSGSGLF